MSISISPAQTIYPARTPLWANIAAGGSPATSTELEISFNDPAVAGNTIRITWGAHDLLFTCVAGAPDDTGLQFTAGATEADSATNLLACLLLNPDIMRDFYPAIDPGAPTAVFLASWAPSPPDEYQYPHQLFFPTVVFDPPGLAGDTAFAGGPTVEENHAVVMTVRVKTATDTAFRRLPEKAAPYIGVGGINLRVDDLLLPYLHPDLPVLDQLNVAPGDIYGEQCIKSEVPFTVEYARTLENGDLRPLGIINRFGTFESPKKAILSGWQDVDYLRMNALWETAMDSASPTNFLTLRGRTHQHLVSKPQRHWLTWYRNATLAVGETINMRARVIHTDGTITAFSNIYQPGNFTRGDRIMLSAGFDQLGLESLVTSGKIAWAYDLMLHTSGGGSTQLTEQYRFHLVDTDYQELHLLYTDSLGSPQVLRTSGAWSQPLDHTGELAVLPANYEDQTLSTIYGHNVTTGPRIVSIPGLAQRRLLVHTGHQSRLAHKAILDCLQSPEWYLADYGRKGWIQLALVKATDTERDRRGGDTEHLFHLDLEFQLGPAEAVHTQPAGFA